METQESSTFVLNHESTVIRPHPDLLVWMERFPRIYREASYYLQEGGDGVREREAWAIFVSDRPYFDYYRTDGAELFTNIRNIVIFCKELLGMDVDVDNPEPESIRSIGKAIAEYSGRRETQTKMHIGYKEKDTVNLPIEKIRTFVEKDQPDIDALEKPSYGVISKRTILYLTVNERLYHWNLYEIFFKNEKVVSNHFITGHSVIMAGGLA